MAIEPVGAPQSAPLPAPTTPPPAATSAPTDSVSLGAGTPDKKKWTVLVYANGNASTLHRFAPGVLRELEAAGSGDQVNIVAQVGRKKTLLDLVSKDWSGVRRYHVQQNPDPPPMQEEIIRWFVPPYTRNIVSPVKEDLGPADMGDPRTLEDFLRWGVKSYPAENYAVVVYGQGGGFAGSVLDEKSGNAIDGPELAQALDAASAEAGKKIDLVAFDGNVMGQLEVADSLKSSARIMVASEGPVSLGSLSLDAVMKDLKFEIDDGHPMTAEDLAKWFVFEARYQPRPMAELLAPTLAAYDLSKIDDVKNAWDALAGELASALSRDPSLKDALREDIKATQSFIQAGKHTEPYEDFRDISHFSEVLLADSRFGSNPALAAAAREVMSAAKAALIDEFHVKKLEHASGFSAYMPLDYGHDLSPRFFEGDGWDPTHAYGDTSVARDTAWDDVLRDIAQDTKFHETLKDIGVPPHVINKMEKLAGWGLTGAKAVLGLASRAGHYEAYQAMRGKPPGNFIFIPAQIATRIGIAGGVYEAFNGATRVFEAATNDEIANKKPMFIDGAAGMTTGAAVTACMIGMNVAGASGVTKPAAVVAFAVPIAQSVYQLWAARNGAAKSLAEAAGLTPDQKRAGLATRGQDDRQYYTSPIVEAIIDANTSGPMDLSRKRD